MKVNLGIPIVVSPPMVDAAINVFTDHSDAIIPREIVKLMLEAALKIGPDIYVTVK